MDFIPIKHIKYIRSISRDTQSFEYLVSQHLRMSGVYWGLCSLSILGQHLEVEAGENREEVVEGIEEWIHTCYDDEVGGFGGNVGHDAHLLYTLSALQLLALFNRLETVNREKIISFIASLQQEDGSFAGDKWGEIDTRFSYCALFCLALLNGLNDERINVQKAKEFILRCKNFDGGFGAVPGAESHAGQIFCCIAALSIIGGLEEVDHELLGWWLAERQCDSGGLNGRPEKQADVCYSWWILSALEILGKTHWINTEKLASFIIQCQDKDDGGISDRPGNMPDVFHTFFGISGLILLKYFNKDKEKDEETFLIKDEEGNDRILYAIDPTYALPKKLVKKLNLPVHVLPKSI